MCLVPWDLPKCRVRPPSALVSAASPQTTISKRRPASYWKLWIHSLLSPSRCQYEGRATSLHLLLLGLKRGNLRVIQRIAGFSCLDGHDERKHAFFRGEPDLTQRWPEIAVSGQRLTLMIAISDPVLGALPAALMVSPWPASRHDWWLDGTVKLSRILRVWRRNRSSVERRISNLEVVRGMSRSTNRLT